MRVRQILDGFRFPLTARWWVPAVYEEYRIWRFKPYVPPSTSNHSFRPLGSDSKPENVFPVEIDEKMENRMAERKFILVHGPKTMGKSTFMREFVRRRQDAGDLAFYVRIDKKMTDNIAAQVRKAMYPETKHLLSFFPNEDPIDGHWEFIGKIIQRNKERTYIIVDNAHQLSASDKWDRKLVARLRELHELYGASVIFVSDVDDPWQGIDMSNVSNDIQLFPDTMRFEPSIASLSKTLSKVGLQKAHIDAILNATGACVDDVAKILDVVHDNSGRDTTLNESIQSAIDSVCATENGRIDHIMRAIDGRGSKTTAILQELSANEQGILDLAHNGNLESYANQLKHAGIVGRLNHPHRFMWAKPLSKLAYKTYGSDLEEVE